MHGPLRLTCALLANYMVKCQMSSGPYGPILSNVQLIFHIVLFFFQIQLHGTAVDRSEAACDLTIQNAKKLGLNDRLTVLHGEIGPGTLILKAF